MREIIKATTKAFLLAVMAIAVGMGVAYATTLSGNSDVNGGTFRIGNDATKNVVITPDQTNGNDTLAFGSGDDTVDFGSGTTNIFFGTGTTNAIWWGGGLAALQFEFAWSANDDNIAYFPGTGATDDLVQIRSDDILLQANNGDVVVQLGS